MIWTNGGFTKFDVATLQVIQTVLQVPSAQPSLSESQDEIEITLVTADHNKMRSSRVSKKQRNFDRVGDTQDDDE